ncbi:hypothetical protein N9N97_03040 [Rickettsiaceae bacterium]|nr:hypothetical protein [Rickettsiaceae bacterium]
MEDFATFCSNQDREKAQRKNPKMLDSSAAPVPMGFIEARMNRDNFWNLMFAVLYIVGFTIGTNIARLCCMMRH